MIIHGLAASDYGEWLRKEAPESGGWFGGGVMHNDWTVHPWPLAEHLHQTNWTVNQALRFMERRDPSCPLFLAVSFIAPHPPLQPPEFYLDRYLRQDLPDPVIGDWAVPPENDGLGDGVAPSKVKLSGERLRYARAAYYALINHVDDQIRRLMDGIIGFGGLVGGETIVVFTADHGEMLGDHYHWRKQVPYESSARIPMLIRGPGRFGIRSGSVVSEPVCLEDVMPTLLDMADVPIPETVEGRSLLPLMRGEDVPWRESLHIEHAPLHQSLTNGREKYVWLCQDGAEQFFDLEEDPNELHDLAREPAQADRVATWRRRLIGELRGRPEGFTDGERLIPGRRYESALPHAGTYDPSWRG